VFKLPFGTYAKLGKDPDEAIAMEFVRQKTSIPVPTVLDHFNGWPSEHEPWFTLMTGLPGAPLFRRGQGNRFATCTMEQRKKMARVLSDWLDQLRRIPPPDPTKVCGFLGGSLFAHRLDLARRLGPFDTPAEFHAQPFCDAFPEEGDERLKRLVEERPTKQYRICFTHGDIVPHNLLADDDFNLTGLVDWETAAWMPEYWERAASTRSHFIFFYGWTDFVPEAFPEYDDDMALEANIQLSYTP
jgi:aminoglycoside phosphotransferase (APT) family kinase protein